MGILRDREERIPVTCAILKDSERDAFFSQIKKNRAGSPEELAKWLAVPVGLINDWISGKLHIPYHTLQSIAYQFSIELPPIGELRRESLPAAQLPSAKPAEPAAPPPSQMSRTPRPREQSPRKQRPPRTPREKSQKKAALEPSERLAYWAGIFYVAVQAEGNQLILRADRRIGQNFAGIWARKTKELFGVSCHLSMQDNGKIQEAACSIPDLDRHLSDLSLSHESHGKEEALPRWIWSNTNWKSAFLKGLFDVLAVFHRKPALALSTTSNARPHVQKLLQSLGFKPYQEKAGMLAIGGREEIERYFSSIGTENMKLRDQWNSFNRGLAAHKSRSAATEPPTKTDVAPSEPALAAEAQTQAIAAPAPAPRKRRPRRAVYRGRPGH